ncbi:MFS transporter [Phormidium tenue FACHB-886]|nr:MFS transporter [Phormidium tenue FACHB-886]
MLPVSRVLPKQILNLTAHERFHQFLILLAAGCLTTMTGGVVSPVLPEMVQDLHLDPGWAGTLVSVHALTSAIATPLMGIVADRVGKLKVMIPCLLLYAFFGTATAFVTAFPLLLATRGLLGAASGGVAAAVIGLLGSMYEGERRSRVLGYATSVMTTSAIFFPLLGGWVGGAHWQYAFYLYALGIPLAAVALLNLHEPTTKSDSVLGLGQGSLGKVVLKQEILQLYLFIAIAALTVYAVVIYTPLYLKDAINADPMLNGFVLAVRLVGAAIVSAIGASKLARRMGKHWAIAFGFSLMALTLATIPFLTNIFLIVIAAILFGIGFGVITPNLYDTLADRSPAEMRASVLAIGTGFNSLGQFVSPVLLGPIWKAAGLPTVFYVAGGIALAAAALSLAQGKRE